MSTYPSPAFFQSFVNRTALKRSPTTYRSLARENIAIHKAGKYTNSVGEIVDLGDSVPPGSTFSPTHVFSIPQSPPDLGAPVVIEITRETTIGALYRLIEIEGESNTAALNFANPVEPGGGFLRGAVAQEEAICRCSTLYDQLLGVLEMYDEATENDGLYTDYMTVIRGVPIFRDDEYEFLEKPFRASFITCAAPVAFQYLRISDDTERLYRVLEARIRKIVQCAVAEGFTGIILGAFGCGAFGNKTEDVATMFRDVLIKEGMKDYFKKIVFAI
jgi:uncharacterized protein (TIGR02452 family)